MYNVVGAGEMYLSHTTSGGGGSSSGAAEANPTPTPTAGIPIEPH
jgi:hypothetical protein